MTKVVSLAAPLNTSFGKIKNINWNWKPPKKGVEYLPGIKIAEIKLGDDNRIIIPIKIIPVDNPKDATIHPLQGEDMTFWIKYRLLEHLGNCDTCLKYVIIHEFTHIMPQFQFPLPWELRGFGKEIMHIVHQYFTDAIIDRWNVKNKNYKDADPIKSMAHRYHKAKVDFNITTRDELFEDYIYFIRYASHCDPLKNNLYHNIHSFPHELQNKFSQLLDVISSDYEGLVFPIYELIRDVAELILCKDKEIILKTELRRRYGTISEMGKFLMREKNVPIKQSFNQMYNELLIHPIQIRHCLYGWKKMFRKIIQISPQDLEYINGLLSKPVSSSQSNFTYFLRNGIK